MNKSLKVHKKSKKYLKRFISKINIFNFDVQISSMYNAKEN